MFLNVLWLIHATKNMSWDQFNTIWNGTDLKDENPNPCFVNLIGSIMRTLVEFKNGKNEHFCLKQCKSIRQVPIPLKGLFCVSVYSGLIVDWGQWNYFVAIPYPRMDSAPSWERYWQQRFANAASFSLLDVQSPSNSFLASHYLGNLLAEWLWRAIPPIQPPFRSLMAFVRRAWTQRFKVRMLKAAIPKQATKSAKASDFFQTGTTFWHQFFSDVRNRARFGSIWMLQCSNSNKLPIIVWQVVAQFYPATFQCYTWSTACSQTEGVHNSQHFISKVWSIDPASRSTESGHRTAQ